MDQELYERFFLLYLKEYNLKYKVKDRIYTVEFDSLHQRKFGLKMFVCTFDINMAQKKKVECLGVGHFMFDLMIAQCIDGPVYSHLQVPSQKADLLDVNEKISEIKKGVSFRIEEGSEEMNYALFEVVLESANSRKTIILPLLQAKSFTTTAEDFERCEVVQLKEKIEIESSLKQGAKEIPSQISQELKEMEKKHEDEMKDLLSIQTKHSEDKYTELKKEEDNLRYKMEEAKSKAVEATTFAAKDKWMHKIKELKRKLDEVVEKNRKGRGEIKETFNQQMTHLKRRDFSVQAQVIAFAKVMMSYFKVKFNDNSTYYYLPALKKFVEEKKTQ